MSEARRDLPRALVEAAAWALPDHRRAWGQAMLADLDHVEGLLARWRFAAGCVRVALVPPRPGGYLGRVLALGLAAAVGVSLYAATPATHVFAVAFAWLLAGYGWLAANRLSPGGLRRLRATSAAVAGAALAGVAAVVGLTVYGVTRYPWAGEDPAGLFSIFLAVVLTGYLAAALTPPRAALPYRGVAARYALPAVAAMGLLWAAGTLLHQAYGWGTTGWSVPASLVVPGVVAALATRAHRDVEAGVWVAACTGLLAGLAFFASGMMLTYASTGWYARDPSTIHDALAVGVDPASYIVGDNLGGLIIALLWMPLLTLAIGAVGANLVGDLHTRTQPD